MHININRCKYILIHPSNILLYTQWDLLVSLQNKPHTGSFQVTHTIPSHTHTN